MRQLAGKTASVMVTDDLTGRTALVTGATRGIGKATAIALARQGARVLGAGRDKERGDAVVAAIRADGGKADFLQGDLHDAPSAKDLAHRATEAANGQIDVLVNHPASGPSAPRRASTRRRSTASSGRT